jgi:hypothetical protein
MDTVAAAAEAGRAEMRRLLAARRAATGRSFTPEQVAQVRCLTQSRAA